MDQYLDKADEEALKTALPMIAAKLHGTHCCDSNSLFESVQEKFTSFYGASSPFRTKYKKVITVVENGPSLKWHEVVIYNIHCVALQRDFKPKPENVRYEVRYYSAAIVDEIKSQLEIVQDVKIKVDKQLIFNLAEVIEFLDKKIISKDENLTLNYDDRTLTIKYAKQIELKKESTPVEITEESILSKDDSWFIWRNPTPICGASVSINLPAGFKFTNITFADKDIWTVKNHPRNTIVIDTDAWVYPGLICFLKWDRA